MERLALIVAIGRGGVIGQKGKLPWSIPEDMKHFRRTTTGHAVIMGRKTFESIGKPLPNRRNVVVSRSPDASFEGVEVVSSLEAAIALARTTDEEPFVIGGSALYREALPLATRIYLTEVDRDVEGDAFFTIDRSRYREIERRPGDDPTIAFVTLERT